MDGLTRRDNGTGTTAGEQRDVGKGRKQVKEEKLKSKTETKR